MGSIVSGTGAERRPDPLWEGHGNAWSEFRSQGPDGNTNIAGGLKVGWARPSLLKAEVASKAALRNAPRRWIGVRGGGGDMFRCFAKCLICFAIWELGGSR